jgi:hypothetical protein
MSLRFTHQREIAKTGQQDCENGYHYGFTPFFHIVLFIHP